MNFLLFGTVWFWLFLFGIAGTIIYFLESALTESEDYGGGTWATILVIVAIVGYYFFGSKEEVISIFSYVRDHPMQIFGYFLGYLAVGVLWAFFKWYFYVNTLMEYVKKRREDMKEYIPKIEIPTASRNKYRIMSWMYYWPFSSFWTLINEPLKKSFEFLYGKIAGTFDSISKKMFADLVKQNEEDRVALEEQKKKEAEAFRERQQKKQQLNG